MEVLPKAELRRLRIRIRIDIRAEEIKVDGVALEQLDNELRGGGTKPEGIIILEFRAHFPNNRVRFEVETHARLGEEELERKEGYTKAEWDSSYNGANEISSALSDKKPRTRDAWDRSPQVHRKMEPSHQCEALHESRVGSTVENWSVVYWKI